MAGRGVAARMRNANLLSVIDQRVECESSILSRHALDARPRVVATDSGSRKIGGA